uniref:Uncharacterized protein n=1 Tax=Pseudictyota dubia TaxID=2749911 RepID=A0A7R9WGT7_9STRA|mmetsp:Transcript_50666/g.93671  ORF Transcript_50666/g.93671 Transcript_50666/m.93671 type:complete len:182 (+) Transcript_50666:380-925(+)
MDSVTEKISEAVDIGGTQMIFGANLPPGTTELPHYEVFYPTKTQYLVWKAGFPTYQLTDADGYKYIVQGYKVETSELDTLGDQFQELPYGWSYNVVTPDEDIVFDLTPDVPIPSVPDEFDQIYIRIPEYMTTCNGIDYSLRTHELDDSRHYLYCELIFNYPDGCGGDVYSTSPLAPCNLTW